MTYDQIVNDHHFICKYVTSRRIKLALEKLEKLVAEADYEEFSFQLDGFNETYHNILKYTVLGVEDPERQKIYNKLIKSILSLADRIKEHLLEDISLQTYNLKKFIKNNSNLLISNVNDILSNDHRAEEMPDGEINETKRRRELIKLFFNYLWLTDELRDTDIEIINRFFNSERISWYDKCLAVSALYLSLMRCFSIGKFMVLFSIYDDKDIQVQQRALVSIIICIYYYDNRISLYPEILGKFLEYSDSGMWSEEAFSIMIKLLQAKDTERVTKKLQEEIIPDIIKLSPEIEEKLDLKNILSEESGEDKNPEWKSFIENSPDLYKKLEEITNMQMQGADIFMSAFAYLKHFEFFNEMPNWFMPFYHDHPDVISALRDDTVGMKDSFSVALESSNYICNSDKYSFCFNVKFLPDSQKNNLLTLFNSELDTMNEMATEDEIFDKLYKSKAIYTQYIQDLYRFYKLYRVKNEFEDVFSTKFDFHNSWLWKKIISDDKLLQRLADFHFDNEHFNEAIEIYTSLIAKGDSRLEIFQKTAYSFQKLNMFNEALDYYLKVELFDVTNTWSLKKIALCYNHLKEYKKALKYYFEIEKLEPENIHVQINIANCYLNLKDFKQALNYYYKVELSAPENKKILRPIAWCLFIMGKLRDSEKYFNMLFENGDPNKFDYLNFGHLNWSLKNNEAAIKSYIQSVKLHDNNFETFAKNFENDSEYLIKQGISKDDVFIMLDYLKYAH
jgi:tetratricopeptide (TPR) repeat protein